MASGSASSYDAGRVRFRIAFEKHEYTLRAGETVIGRSSHCQIRLDDPMISRRHARVLVVQDQCTIEDLGSRNGILVNQQAIKGPRALADGDVVTMGGFSFTLRAGGGSAVENLELDQETQIPESTEYQVPVYRTCVNCRLLLSQGDEKCPHCGAEQSQLYQTIPLWNDPRGRRRSFRAPVKLRGLYVSATMTIEGMVSDLSLGGAFFACELLEEPDTICDLVVFPRPEGEVIRFSAMVVRADRDRQGVGLRFVKMSTAAQTWLLQAVRPPTA
jgi:pSer/pThr/pTyr-binding forkhead associated (FHA) protein